MNNRGLAPIEKEGKTVALCIDGEEGELKPGCDYYVLESLDIAAVLSNPRLCGKEWTVYLSGASEEPTLAVCPSRKIKLRSLHRLSGWDRAGRPTDPAEKSLAAYSQSERLVTAQERLRIKPGAGLTTAVKSLAPAIKAIRRHAGANIFARDHLMRGGRVEIFRSQTDEKIRVWDIRSAYAGAYKDGIPGGFSHSQKKLPRGTSHFAAKCVVNIPEGERVPMAPHRYMAEDGRFEKGKLLFPWGRWQGWFMGPEVLAMAEAGHLESVSCVDVYETVNPLAKFVEKLHSVRMTTKCDLEKDYVKLLLVSGFGVFASGTSYPLLKVWPSAPIADAEMVAPGAFRVWDTPRESMAHGPAAAWITSAIRAKLASALREHEGACYCAVDSVTLPADAHLDLGDGPGDWQPGEAIQGGVWKAPGTYILGGGTVKRAAGVDRILAEDYLCQGTVEVYRRADVASSLSKGHVARKLVRMTLREDKTLSREPSVDGFTRAVRVPSYACAP